MIVSEAAGASFTGPTPFAAWTGSSVTIVSSSAIASERIESLQWVDGNASAEPIVHMTSRVSRNPQRVCTLFDANRVVVTLARAARRIALTCRARHNAHLHTCLRTDSGRATE